MYFKYMCKKCFWTLKDGKNALNNYVQKSVL